MGIPEHMVVSESVPVAELAVVVQLASGVGPVEVAPQFSNFYELVCHIGDSEHFLAVTRVLSWT